MSQISLSGMSSANGMSLEQEVKQIKSYVAQLTDQLKFILSNLGEENFSDEVHTTIVNTAGAVADKVGAEELDTAVKALEKRMDGQDAGLMQQIAALNTQAEAFVQTLTEIEARVDDLEDRVTALEGGA